MSSKTGGSSYVGKMASHVPSTLTKKYPAPPDDPPVVHPYSQRLLPLSRPKPQIPSGPPPGFFTAIQSLLGYGDQDFAFWIIPRGYGMTAISLASCYCLIIWERIKVEKLSKKPSTGQKNPNWYTSFQTMEKEYQIAKSDFVRVAILTALGGLGLPYGSAMGALFWCAGRATRFYEAEEFKFHKMQMLDGYRNTEQEEPVLCRFGKFILLCGICKFGFDYCRGRLTGPRA